MSWTQFPFSNLLSVYGDIFERRQGTSMGLQTFTFFIASWGEILVNKTIMWLCSAGGKAAKSLRLPLAVVLFWLLNMYRDIFHRQCSVTFSLPQNSSRFLFVRHVVWTTVVDEQNPAVVVATYLPSSKLLFSFRSYCFSSLLAMLAFLILSAGKATHSYLKFGASISLRCLFHSALFVIHLKLLTQIHSRF